jgi:hypothetical protein
MVMVMVVMMMMMIVENNFNLEKYHKLGDIIMYLFILTQK